MVRILNTVKEHGCHFAIKSGGHARFAGASNADAGVTIDLVRFNAIKLSTDKQSVTIGAGNRWAAVYRALEADNLTVIGGRVATVGVGGVILGGELFLSSFPAFAFADIFPRLQAVSHFSLVDTGLPATTLSHSISFYHLEN